LVQQAAPRRANARGHGGCVTGASLCVTWRGWGASRSASLLRANHPAKPRKLRGSGWFAGPCAPIADSATDDSAWFRANRTRYDEFLLAPARELAKRLTHLSTPHFFRPYNNLRFRPGPPIKEQLGVAIGYGAAGGYYFELSLDGLLVAAGLHRPQPDQLERLRAAIDDGRKAAVFERALSRAGKASLMLAEPELKRAPRGYPAEHPRLDRLRLKQLTIARRHPLESWLHDPRCDDLIKSELEAARPLVRWLAETVGPSTRPRRP
jgi:uncharacterized protein (TIGR02453 family)